MRRHRKKNAAGEQKPTVLKINVEMKPNRNQAEEPQRGNLMVGEGGAKAGKQRETEVAEASQIPAHPTKVGCPTKVGRARLPTPPTEVGCEKRAEQRTPPPTTVGRGRWASELPTRPTKRSGARNSKIQVLRGVSLVGAQPP